MQKIKLPISALVASYNEGHLLEACLESINFCDEIVGINLDSNDSTEIILKKYVNRYEEHPWVKLIEEIHPKYIPTLKHEWIILIDPDERITNGLFESIKYIFNFPDENIAAYRVPMFNYFKGKKLIGTYYGGLIYSRLLYNKNKIIISNDVHSGIKIIEGFDRKKIRYNGDNFDQHLWCNSWIQLLKKHKRYILGEGQSRYNNGERYSARLQISNSIIRFYYSFKTRNGFKDGINGFILSLLAARYEYLSWSSLRRYQKIRVK